MRNLVPFLALSLASLAAAAIEPQRVIINAPYIETPPEVVAAMMRLAGVGRGDVVYDLGSGDGRIVIAAARRGARGVGIDLYPEHLALARRNARAAGVASRVEFRQQDLMDAGIGDATVVMFYLVPEQAVELGRKLAREARPGTRIVSHAFTMGDWPPDRVIEVLGCKLYYWVVRGR